LYNFKALNNRCKKNPSLRARKRAYQVTTY